MILVDSNEQSTSPGIVADLRTAFPEQIAISQLACGDIAVPLPTGLLLIERKTLGDLLSSIADGRIFSQVHAMVQSAVFPLLLVLTPSIPYSEDDFIVIDRRKTKWRGASVRAALLSVQWAGCAIQYIEEYNYCIAVRDAIRLASKPDHAHFKSVPRKPAVVFYPELEDRRQRIEFIGSIPGIGPKRAGALLDWCGDSLGTALEWASMLHLLEGKKVRPEGWGLGTIQKFRDFLQLTPTQFLYVREENNDGPKEEVK